MKVIVIGASGLLGGDVATHMSEQGHEVWIAARKPPAAGTPMAAMPFMPLDYVAADVDPAKLGGFDAVAFCAGGDPRYVAPQDDVYDHWRQVNSEAIPRFFLAARQAGVKRAALMGSFYHQVRPELVETNGYVRSRLESEQGCLALADESFHVCAFNPPYVVGYLPAVRAPHLELYARWGKGEIAGAPQYAPAGGVNVMSTRSLSEAIANGLDHGRNGHAYLVGDQNMTFAEYFGAFFRAGTGRTEPLPVREGEHPLVSSEAILAGPGSTLFYDIDEATQQLGYRRNDVDRAITEVVAHTA
jgi:dihydroflavonol-4-reductase